jgi:hypothetical protein
MAVAFAQIYHKQQSSGGWTYLLAANGTVDPTRPWTGVYFTSDHEQTLSDLAQLDLIFKQFENQLPLNLLAFVYFAADPAATPAQIGAALDAVNWNTAKHAGLVTWVAKPSAITQATIDVAPRLPFVPYKPPGRYPVTPSLNKPSGQPLLALNPGTPGGESLFVSGSDWAANSVRIGANSTNDALMLSCAANLVVARGGISAYQQMVVASAISAIQIPVSDANNGCLVFDGTLQAPISGIGLGFEYALTVADGSLPSGPLSYPLLDTPDGLAGRPTSAMLSILTPLDNTQCYFSLKAADGPVRSAFRTLLDDLVLLTPDQSCSLVFNPGIGNTLYLTPSGAFAMTIDGGSEPNAYGLGNQLLCGLSGVEYIHFNPGDLLLFYPGGNAAIDVQVDPDLPKPANVTFAFDPAAASKTAWAMVLPGPSGLPDLRQYYSEPDQAPFFATTTGTSMVATDPRQLGFYALSLSQLPGTTGPSGSPYQFPLLPYASFVPPGAGFGADPVYVETFEYALINPTRKALIEAMAAGSAPQSHTGQDSANVTAITPEGYAAVFAGGNWQSFEIAQMGSSGQPTDIEISFAAASGAQQIPHALQDAFLTNQQFLVITSGANLGTFTNTVMMDNWPFTIDLTKNTTVGDYHNVMLFKSANATVTQLARHPELWTRYGDFNNTAGDPEGRFLSNWLVDYLDTAKQLYDGGKGVASLQNFCELIDDPTWNGFLALNVGISTQALPAQIEALLAGIDTTLFVAHHIGNQINNVTPPSGAATTYQLNSAMFGVVHYIDPALGAQVNDLPPYIANPLPYDFKVLTLEAVFENAKLVNFSNKSLLTLNQVFGDTVLQSDASGDPGANTLVLIGSYNAKSNPAYTFSTGANAVTDFFVASNALDRIEITRATMTVTGVNFIETNVTGERQCSQTTQVQPPPPNTTAYLARFNLSGNLRLMAGSDFDLLSYQYLGFDNLGLDMYLVTGGADRSFAFDSSALRIALAQNVAIDPSAPPDPTNRQNAGCNLVRIGSLLAQFPLQLSGFITGCGGNVPSTMGFRALQTTTPAGITPATLATGNSWYALSFDLNLGGQGALGQNGGLSAQMLLAWQPGGQSAQPSVLPALKIAGPGGVSLSFDIEGVVKFGAADIVLNKMPSQNNTPPQYVLMFESIAFTVLSFSFPPQGTTNIFLFGDASSVSPGDPIKPTLGWFGGYFEQPAPPAGGG